MMGAFVRMAAALSAAAALAVAHAQTLPAGGTGYFSCRDASGRLITSDRPILECLNREQREHNADGSVRRVIEAPLTPEQRKARDEEAARRAEAERLADEQRRRDKILLSSYSSVQSLEAARARALAEPQSFLDRARARLKDLQKEKQALDTDKEFYKKEGLPASLQRKIDDNAFGIRYETESIKTREEDVAKINQRFDADKVRLGELLGGATPPAK